MGPPCGHRYERIRSLDVRPTGRKLQQTAILIVEVDTLLSPRLTVGLKPERPAAPRVERMGNPEESVRTSPISSS